MKIKDCRAKIRNKHDEVAFIILKRTMREMLKKTYSAPPVMKDANKLIEECYNSRDSFHEEPLYLNMLCWCSDCHYSSCTAAAIVFISRLINSKVFKKKELDTDFIETFICDCEIFLHDEHPATIKKYGKCIEEALTILLKAVEEDKLTDHKPTPIRKIIANFKKIKTDPNSFYIND